MRENELKKKVTRGIIISVIVTMLAIAHIAVAIFFKQNREGENKMQVYEKESFQVTDRTVRVGENEFDSTLTEKVEATCESSYRTTVIEKTTVDQERYETPSGPMYAEVTTSTYKYTTEKQTKKEKEDSKNLEQEPTEQTASKQTTQKRETEEQTQPVTEEQTQKKTTERDTYVKLTTSQETDTQKVKLEKHSLPLQVEHNELSISVIENARRQLYETFAIKKSKDLQNAAIAVANKQYSRPIDAMTDLGGGGWERVEWHGAVVSLILFQNDKEADMVKRIVDVVKKKMKDKPETGIGGIGFMTYKSGEIIYVRVVIVY